MGTTKQHGTASELNDLGTAARESGDLAGALRYYEQALRMRPNSVAVRINLGLLYSDLGREDIAITQFLQALQVKPGDRRAIIRLARSYTILDNWSECTAELEPWVRDHPCDTDARRLHGSALCSAGRFRPGFAELMRCFLSRPFDLETLGAISACTELFAIVILGRITGVELMKKRNS